MAGEQELQDTASDLDWVVRHRDMSDPEWNGYADGLAAYILRLLKKLKKD